VYVILTSKPGEFRTEVAPGMAPVDAYEYVCAGRSRAHFVIARLDSPTRVRIVDETPPPVVNLVPSKFLPKFESVERARAELESLASKGGGTDYVLRQVPV
jgi:hypothetical protein